MLSIEEFKRLLSFSEAFREWTPCPEIGKGLTSVVVASFDTEACRLRVLKDWSVPEDDTKLQMNLRIQTLLARIHSSKMTAAVPPGERADTERDGDGCEGAQSLQEGGLGEFRYYFQKSSGARLLRSMPGPREVR